MDNYISGCIGGVLGTFASHPIDTLRVRLQSQIKTNKSLFSGVLSPLFGIGIEKAVVFGVYNQTFKHTQNELLSGLNAGLFASFMVTPVEKLKILKQNSPSLTYNSMFRSIINKGPLQGTRYLYNGLSSCFLREIPGYAIYFQTYKLLNDFTGNKDKSSSLKTFINGGLSGMNAWLVIYPFDTIKTNMQQYNTPFISTTKDILKRGGMYKGIHWSLVRAFSLHSCVFLGYELSKKYIFTT